MSTLALHYLKINLRNIRQQGIYSLINIFGLSVSIMAFILILMYLQREYNYDRCWKDYNHIYRINSSLVFGEQEDHFAYTSYNVGQAMKADYPEIEASTMIYHTSFSQQGPKVTIWHDEKMMQIPTYSVADEDFFRVFDYRFFEGNPATALAEPRSMVLSRHMAANFFGEKSALGKLIRIGKKTYQVTGVIDNENCNSHLAFDVLISFSSLSQNTIDQFKGDWFWLIGYNYIRFRDQHGHTGFDEKLELLLESKVRPWISSINVEGDLSLRIEPIRDIHFNTSLLVDSPTNVNKQFVNMFGFIAVFLLLIASINYMNLATARSLKRAREIGIRKVAGAHRSQLVIQFLSESMLYTFIAFVVALILTDWLLPWFNVLIGIELNFSTLFNNQGVMLPLLFGIMITIGLLSGSFPAFVLSSFKPVKVLRPGLQLSSNGLQSSHLRKGLVVVQFIISTGLIISTVVVSKQLGFMRNHDPGIHLQQVMVIHYPSDSTLLSNREVIKQQMLALPEVTHVSVTQSLPGYRSGRLMFYLGDTAKPDIHTMNLYMVDHDFFNLLDVKLLEGRLFSREFPNDPATAFVVNRAAAEYLGYENPVGVEMACGMGVHGKIIGMVENFNYASLHSPIEPLVFILSQDKAAFLAVRFETPDAATAIKKISDQWEQFDRNHYFQYGFLDEHFEQQYMREERMLSLFSYFSLLVIIISCLGLFGLSAYTVEQRSKEIGIRKVLGSGSGAIVKLLVTEFSILVLLAGALALPLTWYLMSLWLNGFAYHVWLNPVWFVVGLLFALIIAVFTVLSQAIKAVYANPLHAIQYE
jgi:putative ABC transport system permease protein